MAKIAAKPVLFKAPVSIGSDEYTAHLSQAELVPTSPAASWTDLDGNTHNFAGTSAWALNLAGIQDYETAAGLSNFLFEHEGEDVEVSFPLGGNTFTATITAVPVNIGGTINAVAAWSKSFPVKGKPTKTAAA